MKILLVSAGDDPGDEIGARYRELASLLGDRHEVTLIEPGSLEPDDELRRMAFASPEHRRSAAVMEAIEVAYGDRGPDYAEFVDRGALGLVPLIARRCGNPLLRDTLIGLRLEGSAELIALHDGVPIEPAIRLLGDLEREQLRLADRVVWPGGDSLGLYRRYYGEELPAPALLRMPTAHRAAPPPEPRPAGEPLRIVYRAELRRSLGALDLAEACLRLPVDDWLLTMSGADTATGPAGQSVRLTIEAMFGGDPRLTIAEPDGDGGETGWGEHDLAVVPPTFAVWPPAAVEAMAAGLPVLATPVGGLTEIVEPGVTGWLAADTGAPALRHSLQELVERREEVERLRLSAGTRDRARRLTDPEQALAGYERTLGEARRSPLTAPRVAEAPLVSGVVPYFHAAEHVEEAVGSLLAQTHERIEVLVVNDGSFEQDDEVLDRLDDPRVRVVASLNRGETAARNLGARLARGEYVVMLDSDNVLESDFVARALQVHAAEPDLAYVSCWFRFIAPDGSPFDDPSGYAPIGNAVVRDDIENWDGDTLALLPRSLFVEHGYRFDASAVIYSDWELYRWLREDGRFGVVIPERLARYRVLPSSLQRAHGHEMQRRGWEEARGRRLLRRTRWTAEARDG